MNAPLCPICKKKSKCFTVKNLFLYHCNYCQLIFQTVKTANSSFTPNKKSWGKNDPRMTDTTLEMKRQTFQLLINEIKKFKKEGLLLDIGTGIGALLEVAQKNKYKTVGLEPEKKFWEMAIKGKQNVKNETLEKTTIKPNSVDIVSMFDVLEHVQDCNQTVKKIATLLKKNGVFVLSTPNTNSLSFKLYGKNWPHYKKEHIYYFSIQSLTKLLEKYGFTVMYNKNSIKALNLEYIAGYFSAFNTPFLTPLSKLLVTILPKKITEKTFNVPNGNILVIAKKT